MQKNSRLFEHPADLPVSEVRRLTDETERLQGMNREALVDVFIGEPGLPYGATREAARLLLNKEIAPEARHAAIQVLIPVINEHTSFSEKISKIYKILQPFGQLAGKVMPFAIQSTIDRNLSLAQDSDLQYAFESSYSWNVFDVHQAGDEYEEREHSAIHELGESDRVIRNAIYRLTAELDECNPEEIHSLLFLLAPCDIDVFNDDQIIAIGEALGFNKNSVAELRSKLSHPGWLFSSPEGL
jgi:hypothetical protein